MSNTSLIARFVFLLMALQASTVAHGQNSLACPTDQLSHSQASDCLAKEYHDTDLLLKKKVDQLLSIAAPVDMSTAPASQVQEKRRQIQDAIRQADALWRKNMHVECNTLLEASFGLGNGWDIAAYECKITRTIERAKFLSTSPSYSWLWQK